MGLRWADGPCGGPGSSLAGYNLGSRLTPASLWCGCFSSWVHRWALSHKLTNLSSLWQLLESKVFCLKLAWCKSTPSHQKKKKNQKLLTSALSTGDAWYPSTLKQCSWVGFPHGHLPPRSEAKGEELVRSCSALLQSQEYVFYRIDSVISYPKSIFFFLFRENWHETGISCFRTWGKERFLYVIYFAWEQPRESISNENLNC